MKPNLNLNDPEAKSIVTKGKNIGITLRQYTYRRAARASYGWTPDAGC